MHFFVCAYHEQLLYKLKIQGLGLLAVNWFYNYLSNSSQLLFSKGRLFSANGSWYPLGIHRWASSHFSHANDLPSVCTAGSSKAVLKTLIIKIEIAASDKMVELFKIFLKIGTFFS